MKKWLTAALNLILPPVCLSCRAIVTESGTLCQTCWSGLRLITPPYCARCGYPFEIDAGDGVLCGPCHDDPFPFSRARADYGVEFVYKQNNFAFGGLYLF